MPTTTTTAATATAALDLRAVVDLDHPAEVAWEVIADYSLDPSWRRGVVDMVPTPAGSVAVGTRTDERLRLAGRTYRNLGVVTDVDPGRSFRWRTVSGARAHGARSVEPLAADRCRVTLELSVTPHGAERLLAPLLGRLLARNLSGDGQRLARFVASRTASSASTTAARTSP